jgi:Holliday junction resolvase RusA-like endonuclease
VAPSNHSDERARTPLASAVFALLDAARIPTSVTYRILRLIADAQQTGKREHLLLEIPGKPVSGNLRVTHGHDGSFLTREATAYAKRVRSIAETAAIVQHWEIPDYIAIDMDIFNTNIDRDNVMKTVNDPLQGIVCADDRRTLDGNTARFKDGGGPRIIATVRKVHGGDYGFAAARKLQNRAVRALPAHVRAAIERAR